MKITSTWPVKDDQTPVWARWLAQDGDGNWWAYEHEPNQGDNGWYENEVGQILLLRQDKPPVIWQRCLIRLKGHE